MLRDARARRLAAGAFLVAIQFVSDRIQAQSPHQILDAVRLEVAAVEDSSEYHLYRYRIVNPASSRGGVAEVTLELSAPPGTGHERLLLTGHLFPHAAGEADHVPFGGIAPDGWEMLVVKAGLDWHVDQAILRDGGPPVSADSAAPGGVKSGFGLRSPYLPGIGRFSAVPTEQSCCSEPNARGELPNSFTFQVRGFTVAPMVRPRDMNLRVVQANLQETCGPLRWIADGAVCARLRSNLERAVASQQGDRAAAIGSLRAVLNELEAQHGPGKPVNDNAYWLLKVNGEYLLAHM